MKIALFGATGMIGSRIAHELEQRGHEVVPATRASGVDATDPAAVARAVVGADAVVSAISARGVDYTLADVARSLVEGLRRAGVHRLVVVGGASSLVPNDINAASYSSPLTSDPCLSQGGLDQNIYAASP
jgi:putative NADH-flavin reductase